MDQPGKDSFRHRQAGAEEVMVVSTRRFALLRETPGGAADLADLAARMAPVDLILAEGFKMDALPKIEVFRAALAKPRLHPETPNIVALATDAPAPGPLPCFALDDAEAIAAWIIGGVRGV
jgi:molybdopterin-guanine dinucleotide biosynthesis protein B